MTPSTVALVHTGGTIGSVGRDRLDLAWYVETADMRSVEELLGSVPEVERIATIRPVNYDPKLSQAFGGADWSRLGRTVHELVLDPTSMASSSRTAPTR